MVNSDEINPDEWCLFDFEGHSRTRRPSFLGVEEPRKKRKKKKKRKPAVDDDDDDSDYTPE